MILPASAELCAAAPAQTQASWTDAADAGAVVNGEPEVSVVLPCLDEAKTIAHCVRDARSCLRTMGVVHEVVVADNGSADGSPRFAADAGARVVHVTQRGYGSAILGGIAASRGRFIIIADADDSYDLSSVEPFVLRLREGFDLVVGNRFHGGIEHGAMPFLHRYLGNPVLTFLGRLLTGSPCGDFHCGLRGIRRDSALALDLRSTGMEFASEMVVKAAHHALRVTETPTILRRDGRQRPSHLRTWRDGWRHFCLLMRYAAVTTPRRRWSTSVKGRRCAVLSSCPTWVEGGTDA